MDLLLSGDQSTNLVRGNAYGGVAGGGGGGGASKVGNFYHGTPVKTGNFVLPSYWYNELVLVQQNLYHSVDFAKYHNIFR